MSGWAMAPRLLLQFLKFETGSNNKINAGSCGELIIKLIFGVPGM